MAFKREEATILHERLIEAPVSIIVINGPRQIGKSTLVRQVIANHKDRSKFIAVDTPVEYSLTDQIENFEIQFLSGTQPTAEWIVKQWKLARNSTRILPQGEYYVLVIDEIQKISGWSELVKGLWDADRAENLAMHVILLGSSPWLMQKGLTESLAGRFELIQMTHWSYPEMQEAFDFSLEEYIYFGGYPGSAHLIRDEKRWREYIRNTLIRPNIEKDILQMTRVDKPALLKTMFELGCAYSGQIISYTKLLGQLQDAGNTVTLAHYLTLLSQAGLITGLTKYAGQACRQRASSPKLNVLNTALISAITGYSFTEACVDRSYWGRLVESTIGAHLVNTASDNCQIQYWRESPYEVDFILTNGRKRVAIEVKSGKMDSSAKGLEIFANKYEETRLLVVGEDGVPLATFLSKTADEWLTEIDL